MVRDATLSDAAEICEIYNYYITKTVITFEETELKTKTIENRMLAILEKFPWLVFEENNGVIGYAYANSWRERIAYRHSVETSVYVKQGVEKRNVGTSLYKMLLSNLKEVGFKQAIGGITLPNENSVKFHEKFGFKKVGHFSKVGLKFNEWHDVGFWQLEL